MLKHIFKFMCWRVSLFHCSKQYSYFLCFCFWTCTKLSCCALVVDVYNFRSYDLKGTLSSCHIRQHLIEIYLNHMYVTTNTLGCLVFMNKKETVVLMLFFVFLTFYRMINCLNPVWLFVWTCRNTVPKNLLQACLQKVFFVVVFKSKCLLSVKYSAYNRWILVFQV